MLHRAAPQGEFFSGRNRVIFRVADPRLERGLMGHSCPFWNAVRRSGVDPNSGPLRRPPRRRWLTGHASHRRESGPHGERFAHRCRKHGSTAPQVL